VDSGAEQGSKTFVYIAWNGFPSSPLLFKLLYESLAWLHPGGALILSARMDTPIVEELKTAACLFPAVSFHIESNS
jgi:hypothetical protein